MCPVGSYSLQPHGLGPTRLLCLWIVPARILEWVSISSSSSFANADVFLKDFIVLPMFSMSIMLLFILQKDPGLLCYNSTTW